MYVIRRGNEINRSSQEYQLKSRSHLHSVGLLHRYDDLRNYSNERSVYLAQLRDSIEAPWQEWELGHFDVESYKSKTVEQVFSGWSRN